jgi:DNA modification methylase
LTVRILTGDCRDVLRSLPSESVHCVVTSPPYWGLRDYGTAAWEGGDSDCNHAAPIEGGVSSNKGGSVTHPGRFVNCKCGARRIDSQIGLEETPQEYVATMVEVFREVRRVLRADGTLWLNMGDSYCSTAPGTMGDPIRQEGIFSGVSDRRANASKKYRPETPFGLKPKDLIGMPWRLAFAMQADGWVLRQDIIYSKRNPMPESVTDRCTKSHEYLFLLSKSARYFYDAEAIKEAVAESTLNDKREFYSNKPGFSGNPRVMGESGHPLPTNLSGRNKRSVWEIATAPFAEAHFATFPPALVEPCIKAGCPSGGTVLDPFGGAGTTGLVADRLQRDAILIELNPEYASMAEQRLAADAGMFVEIS